MLSVIGINDAIWRYRVNLCYGQNLSVKCYGQNLSVKCYWLKKCGVKCYRDPPPSPPSIRSNVSSIFFVICPMITISRDANGIDLLHFAGANIKWYTIFLWFVEKKVNNIWVHGEHASFFVGMESKYPQRNTDHWFYIICNLFLFVFW